MFRRLALKLVLLVGTATLPGATMLVYGPTGGCIADGTPGYLVTTWDAATWSSKTTADFAAFDVIVFGDCPGCSVNETTWAAAIANAPIWTAAITGNKIILGTDPDLHSFSVPAITPMLQNMVNFAANDPSPGPGLYVALSCAYNGVPSGSPAPVPLLSAFGSFTVVGSGCGNTVRKLAVHPALTGVTDTDLSNWSCSTHEGFITWPAAFLPLAMVTDAPIAPYTAADGSTGLVYILASGNGVVSIFSPTYTPPYTPTPTYTISPTFTSSPTFSNSPTRTPTPTVTSTLTASPTPSITETFTMSQTFTYSPTITATPTATPRPLILHLLPPNPNPGTGDGQWLPYYVSVDSVTDITVYTVAGETVRHLSPQNDKAGYCEQLWDDKNESGKPAASGVFIYRVRARSARGEEDQAFSKCALSR